jgi:predicted acyltransferase
MSAEISRPAFTERVMAVDALRGFDMFWIVGGGELVKRILRLFADPVPEPIMYQFKHVPWEGFAAWDLIMPLFLFIVGVSMPISYAKRLAAGQDRKSLYKHMLRRVLILWVLGMIAQGNLLSGDPMKLRLYSNTLQAIASGYAISTFAILSFGVMGQAITMVGLMVIYWLLVKFVPVPGATAGILDPKINLAMYIDETILGRFRDGTTYAWILSTLTFGSTVLLGVMSGHILRADKPKKTKALQLFGFGIACLALGLVWNIWFPIIKHLWTSSFVLFSGGLSILLLAVFYCILDVFQIRKWAFVFVVIGANAIVTYMFGEFFSASYLDKVIFGSAAAQLSPVTSAGVAVLFFTLMCLALYTMYRKKIFIRI